MRNYRNAVATLALALAFSTPASAGIIYAEKTAPTPAPVTNGVTITDAPRAAATRCSVAGGRQNLPPPG